MIGRRCNAGNGISRPVLIARNLSVKPFLCSPSVSQVIYCGGFSSVDPPLSIPNREVKRTYADGTDRPVGRVGSRRSSDPRTKQFARGSFFVPCGPGAQRRCAAPPGSRPPRLFPSATGKGQVRDARKMASRYLHSPSARPSPAAAPPSQRRGILADASHFVRGSAPNIPRGSRPSSFRPASAVRAEALIPLFGGQLSR